jgi:hypothetical protein
MVHVSSLMWRIKNRPSNSTSCSDNAPRLLVLVVGKLYWGLQLTYSFSIWGCISKGYFEKVYFKKAKFHLKGIEDFNLEHWWQHAGLHKLETGLARPFKTTPPPPQYEVGRACWGCLSYPKVNPLRTVKREGLGPTKWHALVSNVACVEFAHEFTPMAISTEYLPFIFRPNKPSGRAEKC